MQVATGKLLSLPLVGRDRGWGRTASAVQNTGTVRHNLHGVQTHATPTRPFGPPPPQGGGIGESALRYKYHNAILS